MTTRPIQCHQARSLIDHALDGSLTLGERELFEAHLATCQACALAYRDAQALDVRMRIALRNSLDSAALTPQRETQIRRQLLAHAAQAQRRPRPAITVGGLVAAIAAVLLVVTTGVGTFHPAPPPIEQPGFVSYAGGLSERDLLMAEQQQHTRIAAPVTIRFVDGSAAASMYAPLVASFQAANTDVTVQMQQPTAATNDAAMLAEEGDCFVGNAAINRQDARDAVQPLTRFVQADAHINVDDFFPQTRDLVTVNDDLYALPRTVQLHLTFFDRSLLERAAVPAPPVGWTSDDLATRVHALRDALPAAQRAFVPYDTSDAVYLLTQRGARASQPQERFDMNVTATAITWYTDLMKTAGVPSLLNDPASADARRAAIAAGAAAIWMGPPVSRTDVRPSVGIVPLPVDTRMTTALQADAFFISKRISTARAGACWRWIRYLSLQMVDSDRVPARYSQVHSKAYLQRVGQRQVDMITIALARGVSVEHWNSTTIAALTDAVDETIKGVPVRNALTRAQRALDSER